MYIVGKVLQSLMIMTMMKRTQQGREKKDQKKDKKRPHTKKDSSPPSRDWHLQLGAARSCRLIDYGDEDGVVAILASTESHNSSSNLNEARNDRIPTCSRAGRGEGLFAEQPTPFQHANEMKTACVSLILQPRDARWLLLVVRGKTPVIPRLQVHRAISEA